MSRFLDGDDVGLLGDVALQLLQAVKLILELLAADGTQRVWKMFPSKPDYSLPMAGYKMLLSNATFLSRLSFAVVNSSINRES